MKKIPNTRLEDPFDNVPATLTVNSPDGKTLQSDPMTLDIVLRMLVASLRARIDGVPAMTVEDSYHGIRLLDALRPFKKSEAELKGAAKPATIDLEDADYAWLKSFASARVAPIFNIMAKPIMTAIEAAEKQGS